MKVTYTASFWGSTDTMVASPIICSPYFSCSVIATRQSSAHVFVGGHVLQITNCDQRGGVLGLRAPIGQAVSVPPLLDFRRVALQIIGEWHAVQLLRVFLGVQRLHFRAEFLEAFAHCFGVGKLVQSAEPCVRHPLSRDDRGIP